jgi:hypothetical protein
MIPENDFIVPCARREGLSASREKMSDEKTMMNRLLAKETVLKRCLKRYCALRSAVRRQDTVEWCETKITTHINMNKYELLIQR